MEEEHLCDCYVSEHCLWLVVARVERLRKLLDKPIRYMSLVMIRISMAALHLPDILGVRLRKTVSVCGKKESV